MAFLLNQQQDEQNQPNIILPQTPAAAGQAPTKSGSFTNLSAYLNANKGNDAAMVNGLRSQIEGDMVNKPNLRSTIDPNTGKGSSALDALESKDFGQMQNLSKQTYGKGPGYTHGENVLDSYILQQGQGARQATQDISQAIQDRPIPVTRSPVAPTTTELENKYAGIASRMRR